MDFKPVHHWPIPVASTETDYRKFLEENVGRSSFKNTFCATSSRTSKSKIHRSLDDGLRKNSRLASLFPRPNPLDFFLWRYLELVAIKEELVYIISAVFSTTQQMPSVFKRLCQYLIQLSAMHSENNWQHVEHYYKYCKLL